MRIDRKELIEALKAVKPGLASKDIIEQSTSFVFTKDRVSTYNDEIMISHPVKIGFEGAIQAQQLYDLLNKCKDDQIEIQTDGSELKIKGHKFKAGIRMDTEISLPIDEIPTPGKRDWHQLPKDFIKAIQYCLFSAGTDMTRPRLTCIYVHLPVIQSCDNQRVTQYMLDTRISRDSINVLVPARSISQFIGYDIESYAVTEGWVHFLTSQDAVLSCRTMQGEYPSVKRIIQMSGEPITFPANMIETLERAEVMSETEITKERSIDAIIQDNVLTIKSKSKAGWYEEEFRVRYSGPPVGFSINAQFLKEILKHLRKAEIDEEGTKLKFTGDSFVHVLALMAKNDNAE